MRNNWQRCCAITLDYEGGDDDDRRDPGGRTSRGITQREYVVWRQSHSGLPADVFKAPQQTIVDIYHSGYWVPVRGDDWAYGTDLCVYDLAVNSGEGRSLSVARSVTGAPTANFATLAIASHHLTNRLVWIKAYQAARLAFLRRLRTFAYFGRGWTRRVYGIEALATKMAAQDTGLAPGPILGAEVTKAQRAQTAAGGASTASTAGVGAHTAAIDWASWVDVAVLVAAVVLIIWLLHIWTDRAVRADEFRKAAKP